MNVDTCLHSSWIPGGVRRWPGQDDLTGPGNSPCRGSLPGRQRCSRSTGKTLTAVPVPNGESTGDGDPHAPAFLRERRLGVPNSCLAVLRNQRCRRTASVHVETHLPGMITHHAECGLSRASNCESGGRDCRRRTGRHGSRDRVGPARHIRCGVRETRNAVSHSQRPESHAANR